MVWDPAGTDACLVEDVGGAEPGIRVPLHPRVLSKTPCGLGPVGTSSDLIKKSFDALTPVVAPSQK